MSKPVRVGVIGCGAISGAYLTMSRNFPIVQIAACADINPQAAEAKAAEFNIPKVCSVDEILADPSIEIILNLTVPKAHVPIAMRALAAGKHTYAEKPLGISRAEAEPMLKLAAERKLLVGSAPDTFLGAGLQTARKVLDDGGIGRPTAFTAFMLCPGHESWHPNPEFYYEAGGGPMFDMGPYYLTALLNLLGPIKRLFGMATIAIPQRTITSKPKFGKQIAVQTPDHVVGLIEFQNGAAGTIVTSFATRFGDYDGKMPITIYGTEGTLRVPDPNGFGGPVKIRKIDDGDWADVPLVFGHEYGRAIGLADMATALRSGRAMRAGIQQAYAVLDAMQGFLDSSRSGRAYSPTAPYARPAPLPAKVPFGVLDE